MILAFTFPSFSQLVEWPDFLFADTPFALNKIGLSALIAMVITSAIFVLGSRKRAMVPTGVQNVAEASIEMIENEIIEPTLGNDGKGHGFYVPLFPPGVPGPIYILVTPIEFISVFLVRPFSLAVRLYANLLAGHILVVTFAVLTAALWAQQWYAIFLPFPFLMLVFVFLFELLVSVLQAYIFTILTAVYIGGAIHPEH